MLQNTAKFNYYELSSIFQEYELINFYNDWSSEGVSVDTRSIINGNIFVALKGEKIDGHSKIDEAIEKGASAVLIEKRWLAYTGGELKVPSIIVDNSLIGLHKLANLHRRRFNLPIIAIGGSNGKTTTKEMAAFLLSQKYKVLKTYENYNNQLGAPLLLLQLNSTYDCSVIEIGTNEPGEISILSSIIEPTHGLITNIGKEHLEKLIDLDGVELEETFLFGYLRKNNGFSFVNADDERLKKYGFLLEKKMTYGTNPLADINSEITLTPGLIPELLLKHEDRQINVKLNTTGYTTALNAIAAAAIGFNLGLDDNQIRYGLETFFQEKWQSYGRMVVEQINGLTIINDCYNANPDSMNAALITLKNYQSGFRKIAILGDMLELGDSSFDEHKTIIIMASGIASELIITGTQMNKAFLSIKNLKNVKFCESKDEIIGILKERITGNEIFLVKGSRGMKMEIVIDGIKQHISGGI